MASAYVLYLNDAIAAPALELIRRVAQPSSRSMPHITVRYPVRRTSDAALLVYKTATISDLALESPGAFMPNSRGGDYPKTVFIQCKSDQLEALVYKPDYPDSVFHVTLYDGAPTEFALALYEIVAKYPWHLQVALRPGTALSEISIGQRGSSRPRAKLSLAAANVLHECTGALDSEEYLGGLGESERLELIDKICGHLHSLSEPSNSYTLFTSPSLDDGDALIGRGHQPPKELAGQLSLWGDATDHELHYKPNEDKRVHVRSRSLFLTPPEVANEMLRVALRYHSKSTQVDFGDPAIGNGIFFAALLANQTAPISSAIGFDLDSKRVLSLRRRWADRGLDTHQDDFLKSDLQADRSLIVANPPYRRYQALDFQETSAWRAKVASDLGLRVDGQSDLFVYFVLAAHRWMREGAVAAWLLPVEFLETKYGQALRTYLATKVQFLRLHIYDGASSRFENARVSSADKIFRNSSDEIDRNLVRISTGDSFEHPDASWTHSQATLNGGVKWSFMRRSSNDPIRPASHATLGQLFRIRRGIATGANRLFVLSDVEKDSLEIPHHYLKCVVPKSMHLRSNVIEADSEGLPSNVIKNWLIDTAESLTALHRTAPRFAEYLTSIEDLASRSRLVRSRRPFYRQEQIPPPTLFFGYMARSERQRLPSRFFLNRSSAVVLNNYLGLYPNFGLQQVLASNEITIEALHEMLSEIDSVQIQDNGRRYVSGLSKSEPGDLKNVTLGPGSRDLLALVTAANLSSGLRPDHRHLA